MSVFGLRCSVNECRIDFLCREDEQIVSVRAKISLPMKQCLLAEDALLAISSACLAKNNDLYHTLKLRSDCCRLSQALSLFGENCIYDDLKWSAFSAALHGFIEILIERSPFQSSIEQVAISEYIEYHVVVMGANGNGGDGMNGSGTAQPQKMIREQCRVASTAQFCSCFKLILW